MAISQKKKGRCPRMSNMTKITNQTGMEVIEFSIKQEVTTLLAICQQTLSGGNLLLLHEVEPHLKRLEDLQLILWQLNTK